MPARRATALNLNAGAFARAQPTKYLSLYGTAGYTVYTDQNADPRLSSSYDAFYWQIGVNHRLNRYFDYDLTGGRTISSGFFAGTVDMVQRGNGRPCALLSQPECGLRFVV